MELLFSLESTAKVLHWIASDPCRTLCSDDRNQARSSVARPSRYVRRRSVQKACRSADPIQRNGVIRELYSAKIRAGLNRDRPAFTASGFTISSCLSAILLLFELWWFHSLRKCRAQALIWDDPESDPLRWPQTVPVDRTHIRSATSLLAAS